MNKKTKEKLINSLAQCQNEVEEITDWIDSGYMEFEEHSKNGNRYTDNLTSGELVLSEANGKQFVEMVNHINEVLGRMASICKTSCENDPDNDYD